MQHTVTINSGADTQEVTNWFGDQFGHDNFDFSVLNREMHDCDQDLVEFQGPDDLIARLHTHVGEGGAPKWCLGVDDEDGEAFEPYET